MTCKKCHVKVQQAGSLKSPSRSKRAKARSKRHKDQARAHQSTCAPRKVVHRTRRPWRDVPSLQHTTPSALRTTLHVLLQKHTAHALTSANRSHHLACASARMHPFAPELADLHRALHAKRPKALSQPLKHYKYPSSEKARYKILSKHNHSILES